MSIMRNISSRVLFTIHESYYILLTLFNCSFLLSLGAGYWKYQKTTAFIIIMLGLQLLSRKFWFTTFLSFIPFYFIKLPLFPRLTNHGNIQVFIGLLLLIFIVSNFRKKNKVIPNSNALRQVFLYPLVAVYVLAGIHKLNSGFFDLSFSCTNHVSFKFNNLLFGEGFEPSYFMTRLSQILTVMFEIVIPFGLLFKATRKISVWLLVIFHAGMSLFGFANFSALAGFLLCGCVINFNGSSAYYQSICKALKIYIAVSIASVIMSYAVTRLGISEAQHVRVYNGMIFNIGWFIFFYILLSNTTIKQEYLKLNLNALLLVLFVLFWAGQAYLGLSNAGNLTMFSNLKTEKSRSNHYLIDTKYTKIWSFEEDIVTIIQIPDELKWQHSIPLEPMSQLPLIEFKSQANSWVNSIKDTIELSIKYQDKIIHIKNLKDSEFSEVEWWYHYVYFRKISAGNNNECLW